MKARLRFCSEETNDIPRIALTPASQPRLKVSYPGKGRMVLLSLVNTATESPAFSRSDTELCRSDDSTRNRIRRLL